MSLVGEKTPWPNKFGECWLKWLHQAFSSSDISRSLCCFPPLLGQIFRNLVLKATEQYFLTFLKVKRLKPAALAEIKVSAGSAVCGAAGEALCLASPMDGGLQHLTCSSNTSASKVSTFRSCFLLSEYQFLFCACKISLHRLLYFKLFIYLKQWVGETARVCIPQVLCIPQVPIMTCNRQGAKARHWELNPRSLKWIAGTRSLESSPTPSWVCISCCLESAAEPGVEFRHLS